MPSKNLTSNKQFKAKLDGSTRRYNQESETYELAKFLLNVWLKKKANGL